MDRSFRAYCRQSPTMQTLAANRRLLRPNVFMLMTLAFIVVI